MANNVDPDEMAYYGQSHLDLHCLQRYQYWSVGMKALTLKAPITTAVGDNFIYLLFFFFYRENKS